jgi:hypothetical protein
MRATSTPSLSSPARSAAPARWLLALTLGLGAVACGEEVRLEGPDAGCTSSNQCAEGEYCFAAFEHVGQAGRDCDRIAVGSCVRPLPPFCNCYFGPDVWAGLPDDGRAHLICFEMAPPDSGVRDLGTRD